MGKPKYLTSQRVKSVKEGYRSEQNDQTILSHEWNLRS